MLDYAQRPHRRSSPHSLYDTYSVKTSISPAGGRTRRIRSAHACNYLRAAWRSISSERQTAPEPLCSERLPLSIRSALRPAARSQLRQEPPHLSERRARRIMRVPSAVAAPRPPLPVVASGTRVRNAQFNCFGANAGGGGSGLRAACWCIRGAARDATLTPIATRR